MEKCFNVAPKVPIENDIEAKLYETMLLRRFKVRILFKEYMKKRTYSASYVIFRTLC